MKEQLLQNAKEFYSAALTLKQQLDIKKLDEFKHNTKNGHLLEIMRMKNGMTAVMLDYKGDVFKGITLTIYPNGKLAKFRLTRNTSNIFYFNSNFGYESSIPESPTVEQFTKANTIMEECIVDINELAELIKTLNPIQKDNSKINRMANRR